MPEVELMILAVAALVTAALTAVTGAGGGMILLIVILQFVDPLVAIPAHGIIQLFSNGTRAFTLRNDVDHRLLGPFLVPLLPFAAAGYLIADAVPRSSGRAMIGVFALVAVWLPVATRWLAPTPDRGNRFAIVGAVAGLTNPIFGAVGPLLAPAFRAAAESHVQFVATMSVAQFTNHVAKFVVFAIAGFALADHVDMIAVAIAGVVVGTRLGARWLRVLDPEMLTVLFKAAVTLGAGRLILEWIL